MITASLVSAAWLFAFQPVQHSGVTAGRDDAAEVERARINANSASIGGLRQELAGIRREFALIGGTDNGTIATERQAPTGHSLERRIERLESAVADLRATRPGVDRAVADKSIEPMFRLSPRSTELSDARHYAIAESSFEADGGTPLGDYEDAIGAALHRAGAIEVQNMNCRKTICRVTYSKTGTRASADRLEEEQELVDILAGDAQGRAVEIRYASDSSGNDVMYIQLQ